MECSECIARPVCCAVNGDFECEATQGLVEEKFTPTNSAMVEIPTCHECILADECSCKQHDEECRARLWSQLRQ